MEFVIFKRGGEAGEVAINPALVTHVRSVGGPFTDVYFKDHRVAVHGGFAEVVARLGSAEGPQAEQGSKGWLR